MSEGGASTCGRHSPFLAAALKVYMQVCLVVTFLSLFFFLYVVKVEKEIFNDQISFIVKDVYTEMETLLSLGVPGAVQDQVRAQILAHLQKDALPSTTSFADIQAQNAQVVSRTQRLVFIFVAVLLASVLGVFLFNVCANLSHNLLENLLALGAIALTEFAFLNVVTRRYLAADPNRVKWVFAQSVVNFAQRKQQK